MVLKPIGEDRKVRLDSAIQPLLQGRPIWPPMRSLGISTRITTLTRCAISSRDLLLDEKKITYRVKSGWNPKDAQERDCPPIEPLRTVIVRLRQRRPTGKRLFERQDGLNSFCKRCGTRATHIGNIKKNDTTIATAAGISQRTTHHMFRHADNAHRSN